MHAVKIPETKFMKYYLARSSILYFVYEIILLDSTEYEKFVQNVFTVLP